MLEGGDARSETSPNKYRKQIDWRRNRVKDLLVRGYSQFQIADALRVSQPTISRDINYILERSYSKHKRDFGTDLFESYQKTIFGTNELLIKTWDVIDNPRIDIKQKLKAISLAQNLHNQLFEYKKKIYDMTQLTEYAQKLGEWAKELEKRENALHAQLLLETTPEERYRFRKRNWKAHESSWFTRGLNKSDGQGCNQATGCVPECRYYAQNGRIEDEEWLRLNEEGAQKMTNDT